MSVTRHELFNIIDKNDAKELEQYLQDKDWKTLFKITYEDNQVSKNPLHYAADKYNMIALNEMVNVIRADIDFLEVKDEYKLGLCLIRVAECPDYKCDTPQPVLAQNLIDAGALDTWAIADKYSLHLLVDHKAPNHALIRVFCDYRNQLDQLYTNVVAVVYAANQDKWEIVKTIALKNPKHFAKHALQVWEIGMKNNRTDKLMLFLDVAIFSELSYEMVVKVKEKFPDRFTLRKATAAVSDDNVLFQFLDNEITDQELTTALDSKSQAELIDLFERKSIFFG